MPFPFNKLSARNAMLVTGCILLFLHAVPAHAHGDHTHGDHSHAEHAHAEHAHGEEGAAAAQPLKNRLSLEPGSMAAYMMSPAYAIYSKALNECYSDVRADRMSLPQDQIIQDQENAPLPMGADGKRVYSFDADVKVCMDGKGVPYTLPEYRKDKAGKIDPTKIDPALKADLDTITRMLEEGQAPTSAVQDSARPSAVSAPVTSGDSDATSEEAKDDKAERESDKPESGERKRKPSSFYVIPE